MTANEFKTAALVAGIVDTLESVGRGANSTNGFIARIKSADEAVRGPAWQGADREGAAVIPPLAVLMTSEDFETARCAKRAIYKIVRHAGRPGAEGEVKSVIKELVTLLKNPVPSVRREALWMLSEIGAHESVAPMAALLEDTEVREDARCALMRLPGRKATAALRNAFRVAPEDFKYALAESLRQRGTVVAGYKSRKLTPTKQTSVG